MTQRRVLRLIGSTLLVAVAAWFVPKPAAAHPHVFRDGGVDFPMDAQGALHGLSVTWRHDAFETPDVRASIEIVPAKDGSLILENREILTLKQKNWPKGFQGFSHISTDGEPLLLSGPKAFDAKLRDEGLIVRRQRDLDAPEHLRNRQAKVAFFERTYCCAFTASNKPGSVGTEPPCGIDINLLVAGRQDEVLRIDLSALDRKETPEVSIVGHLFADRKVLTCAL